MTKHFSYAKNFPGMTMGRWYVYEVNPYAASYDSAGEPVVWMMKSPYSAGESHDKFDAEQKEMARKICAMLNAEQEALREAA
jgi:hypothetical protein